MAWWGKIAGGVFGFMLGGPLGAVLGAALGHSLDKGTSDSHWQGWESPQQRTQLAFFTATFALMGRLAKADGRVSEDEIAFAKVVMAQMQLNEAQRKLAIELFNQGKQADFDLNGVLEQFRRECRRSHNLMQMFLEIQLQAAYADGQLDSAERSLLLSVFEQLGFSAREFDHIDAVVRGARAHAHGTSQGPSIAEAYAILGVEQSAADAEIKKAYKRMMNQHHPDKLVARGLPEEMIAMATEKTQEIKQAYEQIKKSRGMR